ncbi:MAG: cytochrome c [Anaerolineae bacterium]|nr:cytochrome c [Anaerolineae bacterium]
MTTEQPNSPNLYLVSLWSLIFFLAVIYLSWVTLPEARRGIKEAEEPAMAAEEAAPVVAEAAPVQASLGNPDKGQELFTATCGACHGQKGQGVPGLGKDMTASPIIADNDDEALVEFIKVGRDPSDPRNTTGVAMPANGGNPALTDDDLYDIVAFIRALQE